jgi:hypothetical protein
MLRINIHQFHFAKPETGEYKLFLFKPVRKKNFGIGASPLLFTLTSPATFSPLDQLSDLMAALSTPCSLQVWVDRGLEEPYISGAFRRLQTALLAVLITILVILNKSDKTVPSS